MILLIFLQLLIFWVFTSANVERNEYSRHIAYCCLQLDTGDEYLRQGTLISSEFITLNAHFIAGYTLDKVTCILGAQNISQYEPHQVWYDVPISNVAAHEGFVGPKNVVNNIALIKLPEPVIATVHIQPALLPKREDNFKSLVGVETTGLSFDGHQAIIRHDIIANDHECKRKYAGYSRHGNFCILTSRKDVSLHYFIGIPNANHKLIGFSLYSSPVNHTFNRKCSIRIDHYIDWFAKKTNIPAKTLTG